MHKFRVVSFAMAALGALLVGASLSLGPSRPVEAAPEDEVAATVEAAVEAWNTGDVAAFLDKFTERGLQEEFGFASREEAEEILPEIIGVPPITLISIEDLAVAGVTARATVEMALGTTLERVNRVFVLGDDGAWRMDEFTPRPPAVGEGTTVVDMELKEYAFVYDEDEVADGNIAFDVTNTGEEPHELILARINADTPLQELLATEEQPESVETIAQNFWEPGEGSRMAFTQPLSDGRYALLCFVPAPDGTPHALLGMTSEFIVGEDVADDSDDAADDDEDAADDDQDAADDKDDEVRDSGGITPPDTGDAGLQAGGVSANGALTAAGLIVVALGVMGLIVTRRATNV